VNADSRRAQALWLIPAVFCLILYWKGLFVWFQQDDFAWLNLSNTIYNWSDFWKALFAPMAQGTIRPWSERAFFMGLRALAGFNPLPFRLVVFATQIANVYLIFWIVRRITGSIAAATLAPILWVANSVLVRVMTWSSVYNQALCAFCLLLAFAFFLQYTATGRRSFYVAQWCVFLFGFGALEINVVYPALALIYALVAAPKYVKRTVPLFLPSIIFAGLHRFAAGRVAAPSYAMYFDASLFSTLRQYWKSALGLEEVHFYFLIPTWVAPAGTWILTIALVLFLAQQLRRRRLIPLVFLAWFFATLAPVLPLRDHISEYYLTIPTIGLAMLGGWAVAEGWKGAFVWKIAATAVMAIYLAAAVPVASAATEWFYVRSRQVEKFVTSAASAHGRHPDRILLLNDVSDEMFWTAMIDNPFRALGIPDVFLTPEAARKITPHPEIGQVSEFTLPAFATLEALNARRAVVYEIAGVRPKNITLFYSAAANQQLRTDMPRRVDVGNPLFEGFLGPTWYKRDGAYRWMPDRATLRIGGPRKRSERLYISGFIPARELDKGPLHVKVEADGIAVGTGIIERGMDGYAFDFALPDILVGRDSIELTIGVDRTFVPPEEGRRLGLVFGVFEIR
jgi:hypothetical protein